MNDRINWNSTIIVCLLIMTMFQDLRIRNLESGVSDQRDWSNGFRSYVLDVQELNLNVLRNISEIIKINSESKQ